MAMSTSISVSPWGPLILGHAPDCVVEAIQRRLLAGFTFGAQHDLEYEVSELLTGIIPCADLVSYANSGTEIVLLALRLARAVTGRTKYLKFEGHYHGWGDQALVSYHPAAQEGERTDGEARAGGEGTASARPHRDRRLEQSRGSRTSICGTCQGNIGDRLRAVAGKQRMYTSGGGFLEFLRETATRNGALLIFDEVITGFRVDLGGAQTRFGVTPDLATFAKAVGAGLPVERARRQEGIYGADCGRRRGPRRQSEWQSSDSVRREGRARGVTARGDDDLSTDAAAGGEACGGPGRESAEGGIAGGEYGRRACVYDSRAGGCPRTYRDTIASDKQIWSDFVLALLDEGVMILPDGRWYISAAHSEADIDATLGAVERAARTVGTEEVKSPARFHLKQKLQSELDVAHRRDQACDRSDAAA